MIGHNSTMFLYYLRMYKNTFLQVSIIQIFVQQTLKDLDANEVLSNFIQRLLYILYIKYILHIFIQNLYIFLFFVYRNIHKDLRVIIILFKVWFDDCP